MKQKENRMSSSSHQQQNEVFLIAPSSEGENQCFTAKFPLNLCINCCSTIENFAELHQAFSGATSRRQYHQEKDDNEEQENQNKPEDTNSKTTRSPSSSSSSKAKKKKRSSSSKKKNKKKEKTGSSKFRLDDSYHNHNTNSDNIVNSSFLPPSFFSELPSVLQIELPVDTDMETLQLYSEFHCGGSYFDQHHQNNKNSAKHISSSSTINQNDLIKKLELNEVSNWGTEREQSIPWREAIAKHFGAISNPLLSHDNQAKPRTRNRQNPALEFAIDEETVDHANLSPYALQDRNPSVLLSACSRFGAQQHHSTEKEATEAENEKQGCTSSKTNKREEERSVSSSSSILPHWEQKWVQENFLVLDSPACCAKAAKLAVLAEFLGCDQLIQLCAVIIAARLSERGSLGSTEYMQWCLMGRIDNTSASTRMIVVSDEQ